MSLLDRLLRRRREEGRDAAHASHAGDVKRSEQAAPKRGGHAEHEGHEHEEHGHEEHEGHRH